MDHLCLETGFSGVLGQVFFLFIYFSPELKCEKELQISTQTHSPTHIAFFHT